MLNLQAEILLHKGRYTFGILKLVEVERRRASPWNEKNARERSRGIRFRPAFLTLAVQALRVRKENEMVPLFMSQVRAVC